MPEAQISWPQLVALMALGDGPDPSMRGIVRTVEATYVEENEPADLEIPGQGRYQTRDGRVRIYKRGNLVRRERLDGRLLAIEGVDYLWIWEGDEEVPTAFPRDSAFWGWPDSSLTQRRGMDEWRDDDFTRPTGPPTATRFLGRDAWQVELRPPSHKPFPLTLIIDAATGLVLHQRNDGFRSVVEWEELELEVALTAELFTWEGESRPPPDHDADHEADMARRREWLSRNGVRGLNVTLPVELMLNEQEDDGAFHATLTVGFHGSLVRRPQSDEPWDPHMNWPHMHRWAADGWDWWLGTDEPLSEAQLTEIQSQLRE